MQISLISAALVVCAVVSAGCVYWSYISHFCQPALTTAASPDSSSVSRACVGGSLNYKVVEI